MAALPASTVLAAPGDDLPIGEPIGDLPIGEPPAEPAPGREESVFLQGYRARHEHIVHLQHGRVPDGDGLATATFRVPELVVNATVSAELNGRPIGSWPLGDGPTITQVDVPLPASDLVAGQNVLRLTTAAPLAADGACRDWSHPARWLELFQPLEVALTTVPGPALRLADYPEAYDTPGDTTTIIVGQRDGPHLTAAATIGASLVEAFGREHVIVLADDDAVVDGAQIYLGVDSSSTGISIAGIDDGSPRLELVATHGEQLVRIAEALTQPGARSRMTGSRIGVIDAVALPTDPIPPIQEVSDLWLDGVTLDELGFGGASLEGKGIDRVTYTVDLPVGGTVSFMELSVAAVATAATGGWSPGLDAYVNGRLVGHGDLDSEIETYTFDVPGELLRPGTNFIRFESDLGSNSSVCGSSVVTSHRVDIVQTTEFRLHEGVMLDADLDHMPYTLRSFSDTRATAIVAPIEPTIEEATQAVQLAVLLGGRGLAGPIATGDQLPESALIRHRVIFGTVERQPLFADPDLMLPLGTSVPERWPPAIELQLTDMPHNAAIQMIGDGVAGITIAVTGRDDDDVRSGMTVLLDSDLRNDLSGSLALVAADLASVTPIAFDGDDFVQTPAVTPPESEFDLAPATTERVDSNETEIAPVASADDDDDDDQPASPSPVTDLAIIGGAAIVIGLFAFAARKYGIGRVRSATT